MKLTLPAFDDFHIHLRNDDRMPIATSRLRMGGVVRGIVMPNIVPKSVDDATDATAYVGRLKEIEPDFTYCAAIKLTPQTTEQIIIDAVNSPDVLIGKQYPAGVTTNSENGVTDISAMYEVYGWMEKYGLPLSLHGEVPKTPVLDAEHAFLPILRQLNKDFPNLKIIMEHISTAKTVETVLDLSDKVAATITPQHLVLTVNDILAGKLNVHNYCMPVAKTEDDRQALIAAIKSGNPKFFFGSDSAPHYRTAKEAGQSSPGIFSTPVIAPLLTSIFAENDMLDKLEHFTSKFGAEFYGLKRNTETITLSDDEPYTIPDEFEGIVPLCANKTIPWNLVK